MLLKLVICLCIHIVSQRSVCHIFWPVQNHEIHQRVPHIISICTLGMPSLPDVGKQPDISNQTASVKVNQDTKITKWKQIHERWRFTFWHASKHCHLLVLLLGLFCIQSVNCMVVRPRSHVEIFWNVKIWTIDDIIGLV